MAPADQPVHFLDRVHRSATGAVAVGIVLEVRLEDRFQHELGSGLHHPIPDRRNAERSLASVRLRYGHPPHRIGPVRLRHQFLAQARQPPLQARRLDLCKGHSVPARRTRICSGQRIGVTQDVLAINLVVEQIEAEGRLNLRLTIQLSLKGPDRCRCCQAHRQSLSPSHLRKRTRSQGPLLRRHYPASTLIRPCPIPVMAAACRDVEAATLALDGPPPITRTTFFDVPCPLPRRIERVRVSITSPLMQPSPNGRRVGIRIVTFEMLWGERRGQWHHRRSSESMERPMQKLNDLSRSLTPLNPDGTLIAVIEMSQSSWLVAGIVPGIER